MTDHAIHGIIGYTITPFDRHGALALDALDRSIDHMIDAGVHAIAPLGSTGEGAYLTEDEWTAVAESSIRTVSGRVPTVVSVSDLTTSGAVRRAKAAEAFGATAVMVLPTSYWKLQQDEIVAHYQAIGSAIGIPIMLYNNHAVSGIDMSVDLILQIVDAVDNVTMVKESTGDIQRMHQLHIRTDGGLPFYNGSNPLALEAFAAGAVGWCTAAANLIAKRNIELYDATREGRLADARDSFYRQLPLLDFILKGGLPKTIKAGLGLIGMPVGDPRAPVKPLGDEARGQLAAILGRMN